MEPCGSVAVTQRRGVPDVELRFDGAAWVRRAIACPPGSSGLSSLAVDANGALWAAWTGWPAAGGGGSVAPRPGWRASTGRAGWRSPSSTASSSPIPPSSGPLQPVTCGSSMTPRSPVTRGAGEPGQGGALRRNELDRGGVAKGVPWPTSWLRRRDAVGVNWWVPASAGANRGADRAPPATTGRHGRSPTTAPGFRGWSWPPSLRMGRSSAGSASTPSASRTGHRHPDRCATDARERPEGEVA